MDEREIVPPVLFIGVVDQGAWETLWKYIALSLPGRINLLFEEMGAGERVPEDLPEMKHVARRSRSIW